MKAVKFYETSTGKVPVREFLDSLDSKHAQKVLWVLELIEKLDRIPTQYFKKLKIPMKFGKCVRELDHIASEYWVLLIRINLYCSPMVFKRRHKKHQ